MRAWRGRCWPMQGRGLGKGLGALFAEQASGGRLGFQEVDLGRLVPGADQPRRCFDQERLEAMAESIRTHGIIQPILVRPLEGAKLEIVAGERRWRAARLAGLSTVPVWVKDVDAPGRLELALLENLQREDLNAIEKAQGIARLVDGAGLTQKQGLTQDQIAQRLGLSRSTVTNLLRLLELEPRVQELVIAGRLSMGQARSLLAHPPGPARIALAERVAAEAWSVRKLEAVLRKPAAKPAAAGPPASAPLHPVVKETIDELQRSLGTRVRLEQRGDQGYLAIEFYDRGDLHRILDLLVQGST